MTTESTTALLSAFQAGLPRHNSLTMAPSPALTDPPDTGSSVTSKAWVRQL